MEQIVASTCIKGLDKMTKKGRQKIARWLRSRADWVEKHGDLAASTFRQRLYWDDKKK